MGKLEKDLSNNKVKYVKRLKGELASMFIIKMRKQYSLLYKQCNYFYKATYVNIDNYLYTISKNKKGRTNMSYKLPKLNYAYDALSQQLTQEQWRFIILNTTMLMLMA